TVNYYVPGLIGFTVLTTMFNMVYQVPNYRKEKIFRQLSFSGLTKSEWMVANILHSFVMLIISDIILVLIAIEVFGASLIFTPVTILLSGVIVFAGLIFFMGLGILAGLVSDNEETVSVVGNLILFPMMFLSGVFFPLAFAPQYLQIISKFLPLTYFITALNSTLIYGNYYTIYLQIILLAVSSLIIFFVAARLFSWKQK
ncbi:MAG: ABC transporter permease, partial [Thermoplasmata archaeon]